MTDGLKALCIGHRATYYTATLKGTMDTHQTSMPKLHMSACAVAGSSRKTSGAAHMGVHCICADAAACKAHACPSLSLHEALHCRRYASTHTDTLQGRSPCQQMAQLTSGYTCNRRRLTCLLLATQPEHCSSSLELTMEQCCGVRVRQHLHEHAMFMPKCKSSSWDDHLGMQLANVADLCHTMLCEQHIGRLEVAMDDLGPPANDHDNLGPHHQSLLESTQR